METKESITGLRFIAEPTQENVAQCSEQSARLLRTLVERHNITYNQILYPYADALSLSGVAGTQSTRIFGTHILLRNVPKELIDNVMHECFTEEKSQIPVFHREIVEFPLTDGMVKSSDIAEFLGVKQELPLPWAGEFAGMLGGWLPHWRIRECARYFASFSEMSYRRAKGEIVGLYGGRLILTPECNCPDDLAAIFTQKTGA